MLTVACFMAWMTETGISNGHKNYNFYTVGPTPSKPSTKNWKNGNTPSPLLRVIYLAHAYSLYRMFQK